MTDLDAAALWAGAPGGIGFPRKCRRHRWDSGICASCGKARDEAASKRGRNARLRGNRYELTVAEELGGRKVGHFGGPEDVTVGMFVIQAKRFAPGRFPGWMADELDKLPRTDGRVPLLVVSEAAGRGRRGRALAIVTLDDWRSLHGRWEAERE